MNNKYIHTKEENPKQGIYIFVYYENKPSYSFVTLVDKDNFCRNRVFDWWIYLEDMMFILKDYENLENLMDGRT